MSTLQSRYGYRTALVTGASSGLGRAFARMLRLEGLTVCVTSRDGEGLPTEPGFLPLPLDLTGPDAGRRAAAEAALALGAAPDVLVNNAGAAVFSGLARFPAAEIGRQLNLLLAGPIQLACAFLPAMIARNRGVIANISSLAMAFPIPGLGVYSAAKAGLSGFSRSLMIETAATEVQVLDFQPGDYRTNFHRAAQRVEAGAPWEIRAWERFYQLVEDGPAPERAACDLRRALRTGGSGTLRSGKFLHVRLGALAHRVLGRSFLRWVVRKYYGLQ